MGSDVLDYMISRKMERRIKQRLISANVNVFDLRETSDAL